MPEYRIFPVARMAGAGLAGLVGAFLAIPAGALAAQPAIGGATVVKNDVRSKQDGRRSFVRLTTGGHVFTDDLVQTRLDSMTKIVFLDTTNMSVGPDSIVKLDKFVYNGDGTAKDVVINATKGAFRFFSGKSPSKAYQVSTPQAVIGVRGTTYDVRVSNGVTLVVLQDGEVNVCVRNTARCRVLNQPGQSVSVDNNDVTDPLPPANKPWDFATHCANGASDLCNKTTQFALAPMPPRNAAPQRGTPQRRVTRQRTRPARIHPVRLPRRIVRRPVYDGPIYDAPPPGIIVEGPVRVGPGPCPGYWRRGRCIVRPIVRPRPNPCLYSSRGCRPRPPIVRPKPNPCAHGRCGVRPPVHGRPGRIYRPPQAGPRLGQNGRVFRRPVNEGRVLRRAPARSNFRNGFGSQLR